MTNFILEAINYQAVKKIIYVMIHNLFSFYCLEKIKKVPYIYIQTLQIIWRF